MRSSWLLAIPSLALLCACSDAEIPNSQIYFISGEGNAVFEGVVSYRVESLDTSGKIKKLFKGKTLPERVDTGVSGTLRFRATGFDANGAAVVRGQTLPQNVANLLGGQIPLQLARTDRATLAEGRLTLAPGAFPKVAIYGYSSLWVWANVTTDQITTDAYNFAYWTRVAPKIEDGDIDLQTIKCFAAPCVWKNLVIAGNYYAFAIADEWAVAVDGYLGKTEEFKVPAALGSFSNVAGGTVFEGAISSAVLVGATRQTSPTAYTLLIDNTLASSVSMLSTARAGAAALFESDVGLVVVGGSSTGVGVERVAPGGVTFTPLNYPADPVVGATLVVQDATHVLRMGGTNPDGTLAPTAEIDVTCALEQCAAVPYPDLALNIAAARSFFDNESGDSILVGEDATGLNVIYRYSPAQRALTPIPIPVGQQRVHATAIELPNRQIALIGGTSPEDAMISRSIISVVSF